MGAQAGFELVWEATHMRLTVRAPLQAAGGAAGDDAAERDGERPVPVPALRGGAGLPGQLLGVLQGLPEGKASHGPSALAAQRLGMPECVCVCGWTCACRGSLCPVARSTSA